MPGRFEGLNDEQWSILSEVVSKKSGHIGRPRSSPKAVLNTILYVLITGCRWCDVPRGEQWGKRSTAHDQLRRWQEDGTLKRLKYLLLELAELVGAINWERGSVDGAFSPRAGWRRRS